MGHRMPIVIREEAGNREKGQDYQHSAQSLPPPGTSEPYQSPPYRQNNRSNGEKSGCLEVARFVVEVLTFIVGLAAFIALLFYVGATRHQVREMRRANRIAQAATDDSRKATADALQETRRSIQVAQEAADAAQKQAQTAIDTLHAQRPYVSVGREDGTVAEYKPPARGEKRGTVLLYFRNTGSVAATNFLVNVNRVLSQNSPLRPKQEQAWGHIERWRVLSEGKPDGGGFVMGATIGTNSTYVKVLPPDWTPSADEWELISVGKSEEGGFSMLGNLEYCDGWGKYHCEMFDIRYSPAPVGIFTARMWGCPSVLSAYRDLSAVVGDPKLTAIPLPRCEQPGERETLEKENNQ
jgi:hypothetical protein